MLPHLL
jgi:hypothetical protein